MEAILAERYDVISGPAGQARDWDRMRALFVPGARLIPAVYRPDSVPTLRMLTPDQYIASAGPRLASHDAITRRRKPKGSPRCRSGNSRAVRTTTAIAT